MGRRRKRHIRYNRLIACVVLAIVGMYGCVKIISSIVSSPKEPVSTTTPTIDPFVYNDYDWSSLSTDDLYSYEDETYTSKIGIDVSYSQKTIDWEKVKNAGIEFAVIRVGYRGYQEGLLHTDDYFHANIEQADTNGIETAVYFFSQALNTQEIEEEVAYVLEEIQGYDVSFVAYDLEEANAQGRIKNLTQQQATENALLFCQRIEEAGYTPMVYGSYHWLISEYDFLQLQETVPIWMASYEKEENASPSFPYVFTIWQYSNKGSVDGIDGDVDLDLWIVEK